MSDETPASGFRSLVEKIQENNVADDRPFRRRSPLPRRVTPVATVEEAPRRPSAAPKSTAPRLLSRRWL